MLMGAVAASQCLEEPLVVHIQPNTDQQRSAYELHHILYPSNTQATRAYLECRQGEVPLLPQREREDPERWESATGTALLQEEHSWVAVD